MLLAASVAAAAAATLRSLAWTSWAYRDMGGAGLAAESADEDGVAVEEEDDPPCRVGDKDGGPEKESVGGDLGLSVTPGAPKMELTGAGAVPDSKNEDENGP